MKKLIGIFAFFAASSVFAGGTYDCTCVEQDDFGSCIRWVCNYQDNDVIQGPQSLKIENKKLLESILKNTPPEASELQIVVKDEAK